GNDQRAVRVQVQPAVVVGVVVPTDDDRVAEARYTEGGVERAVGQYAEQVEVMSVGRRSEHDETAIAVELQVVDAGRAGAARVGTPPARAEGRVGGTVGLEAGDAVIGQASGDDECAGNDFPVGLDGEC